MYYNSFKGKKLSGLGFGLMRLPTRPDGTIDQEQLERMVDMAMEAGVNYFDTAFTYHGGTSEAAACKALARYPRESYYFADKYPGHQTVDRYEPDKVFAYQLERCDLEYFDFYLLHNVCESDIDVYTDPQWGIVDYFIEQRRKGTIRHLGFSSHGKIELLKAFLERYGSEMEFCQIQLNYVDWTLQDAKAKVELLEQYNIPVWVMEPVRGGKLANLPDADGRMLRALRPDDSQAAWAMRWVQGIDSVKMILSGMSNEEQMQDNIKTFARRQPTTAEENEVLAGIARRLSNTVPCTACRYCCDGCPMGLDIPTLLNLYNDLSVSAERDPAMFLDVLPEDKRPAACIACGQCSRICPQGIDIPAMLENLCAKLDAMPQWADTCRKYDRQYEELSAR